MLVMALLLPDIADGGRGWGLEETQKPRTRGINQI
jgi:hypothetical protein